MSNVWMNAENGPTSGVYTGFNTRIKILDDVVGRADRLDVQINNNITQYYVVSSRTPINIEGRVLIRGTLRGVYFNTAIMRLVVGEDKDSVPSYGTHITGDELATDPWMTDDSTTTPSFASPADFFRLPEVSLTTEMNGWSSTEDISHYVRLDGVKFDSFAIAVRPNEAVMETATFFAEKWHFTNPSTPTTG